MSTLPNSDESTESEEEEKESSPTPDFTIRELGNSAKETIPKSLRYHFFTALDPPDANDYNVFGFDLDHCLVKYNVVELTKLII